MKMKIKKFGKMNSSFEFSISKLGYMAIFMKICAKKILTHFVGYFWLIEAKINMKIKKIWENESNFEILHIKIRLCGNFNENPRKKYLTHFLKTFLTPFKNIFN